MEPDTNKILRSKILEAENKQVEWDREKVLAGLNFNTANKKSMKPFKYYTIAASTLLFVFIIQYNTTDIEPIYKARIEKGKSTLPVDTSATKNSKTVAEPSLVANSIAEMPKESKITTKLKPKTAQIPLLDLETPNIQLAENTITITNLTPVKTQIKKREIVPIIGIAYKDNTPTKTQKPLPLHIDFGTNANTLVYSENSSILRTKIN